MVIKSVGLVALRFYIVFYCTY